MALSERERRELGGIKLLLASSIWESQAESFDAGTNGTSITYPRNEEGKFGWQAALTWDAFRDSVSCSFDTRKAAKEDAKARLNECLKELLYKATGPAKIDMEGP